MWIYCPWKEKGQGCKFLGYFLMRILLKNQPGQWYNQPLHQCFRQRTAGFGSVLFCFLFNGKTLMYVPTVPNFLWKHVNTTPPSSFPSPLPHLSENAYARIHLSVCPPLLLSTQKSQSTCADWHCLSRSNGAFCACWRIFAFFWALFVCMNQNFFKK